MKAFNNSEFEQYKAEAKEKWGKTEAYQEYEKRNKADAAADGLMAVFSEFGALFGADPAAEQVQAKVAKLQQFITDHYYTCTKQILQGLGQMYVADARFKENIDRAGGPGTAEFAHQAIEIYCK